jgi:hypothetical protein
VIRKAAAALALAFVLAHLPFLPSSLEDIDSVNFALGIRDFDVARHQPHPPGYPVYIGVAKTAVAVLGRFSGEIERSTLEARAMGWISLAGAAIAILLLYRLLASFVDESSALAATALTAACPLFWYMAVRPMSDMAGFAAALAALACAARAWVEQGSKVPGLQSSRVPRFQSGQLIVLGSLLAAIAIGFRSQNAVLTLPFLVVVLMDRIGKGVAGALLGGSMAFAIGALAWGVPLIVASGGPSAYLAALGSQAGEDFAGVDMLSVNPSPRLAADALLRTLIYPWDAMPLGVIVVVLAAIGVGVLVVRDRRALVALSAITLPYFFFHLLFHDMEFVRYALPIVPGVAFLAVCGVEGIARRASLPIVAGLAIWAVAIATPIVSAYAAEPSPVVRAVRAMGESAPGTGAVLGMHQTFQRPIEAETLDLPHRLPAPPRREWLELARYWRDGNTAPVWFLADPRRTDLALIDSHCRVDRRDFAWRFSSLSQMGGMRPAGVHWYQLTPPGWFAEEGWALTPETAGIARSMQRGPHLGPIRAWVRRRAGAARMVVGGRHLGGAQDPAVVFAASIDGRDVATWRTGPGFFLHVFDLPAGALGSGNGLAALEVRSSADNGASVPTAIEQFDLQSAGSLMWGFADGWQEAEYNPRVGLWRWASERSALRFFDATTPVRVRLQIESPRRYFDQAPTVRLTAGGRVLAEAHPESGFTIEALVPIEVLNAANGLLVLETDRVFVPAERGGPPDQRHLGLRVFGVDIVVPN